MRMEGRRWHRLGAVAVAAGLVVVGATMLRTDSDEDVAVRASGGIAGPVPEHLENLDASAPVADTTVTTAVTTSTAGEDPTVIAARRRPPTTSTTRPKPTTTSTTLDTTTTTTTGPAPGPAAGGVWTMLPPSPLGGRDLHGMVWTGNEVLVMVGFKGQGSWKDSAAYNPATKTWRSLPEAPQSGWGHAQGVWTGREAIIWGAGDGASDPVSIAYDPATDRWRRISPGPLGMRTFPTMVWTGKEVLVWGGYDISNPPPDHSAADGAANPHRLPEATRASGRRRGWQGESLGGGLHPRVVRHDRLERGEGLSGGEVDRIEAAEWRGGREGGGPVEQLTVEVELVETGELAPGQGDGPDSARGHGADNLDAGQRTRRPHE
jgi:hypothetical protein